MPLGSQMGHVDRVEDALIVHLDVGVLPFAKGERRPDQRVVVEWDQECVSKPVPPGDVHHVREPDLVVEVNQRHVVLSLHRLDLFGRDGCRKVVHLKRGKVCDGQNRHPLGVHHRLDDKAPRFLLCQEDRVPVNDASLAVTIQPDDRPACPGTGQDLHVSL